MAEQPLPETQYSDEHGPSDVGYCTLPPVEPREFPGGFDPDRASAILLFGDKWVNRTELRYAFVEEPPNVADLGVVRNAFEEWQELPIGLRFAEVTDPNEAEVRIGFDHGDGSWSYVGRQVLNRPISQRTMNFGWTLSGWTYGRDTALHEIGHTLGLPHEHQNPKAGIVWDEQAVLQYFAGPPNNWSPEKTEWNILRKIDSDTIQGSAWDPDSIMHYAFKAGLVHVPEKYQVEPLTPKPGLSSRDIEWIQHFYPGDEDAPPTLEPFRSQHLDLQPGQQADFVIRAEATRQYNFATFGAADTVMVLFEKVDSGPEDGQGLRHLAGDDDSGTDLNARFRTKLFKGREYVLRIRLYWSWASGQTGVMMW